MPAICWIPGGGYIMHGPMLDDATCHHLVITHDCVVVAVLWRLAPEHPFPAASEDCYGALAWLASDSGGLGIDPSRVVIAGQSSGGGSAASVALLVRERREFAVAHQMPVYPMLDDRNDTPSAHLVTDANAWNQQKNALAWRAYLGERTDGAPATRSYDESSPHRRAGS